MTKSNMTKSDDENLLLVTSSNRVDDINARFYSRFTYPWQPMKFDYCLDPDFETVMLNQNLGDWKHNVLPKNSKIWVAGCGTNQAIFTALRFPNAIVLGTDLSSKSLEISANVAKDLNISNLQLKEESINKIDYKEKFDYIICTGVIHHNADPKSSLQKLTTALKPTGILELMVYNRYHRIYTSVFQKAIRILGSNTGAINFESELFITQKLINSSQSGNSISDLISDLMYQYQDVPESALADTLMQPVEYSYTVESLEDLANTCGLELVAPCLNQFDKAQETFSWNMTFKDSDLQNLYNSLPDLHRWQVSNLLLLEKSPMLWFYLQRQDSGRPVKSEKRICEEFLDTKFIKAESIYKTYILGEDEKYMLLPNSFPFPLVHLDVQEKKIFDLVDAKISMREIFERLSLKMSFQAINQVRLKLTTSAFPYLKAVQSAIHEVIF